MSKISHIYVSLQCHDADTQHVVCTVKQKIYEIKSYLFRSFLESAVVRSEMEVV